MINFAKYFHSLEMEQHLLLIKDCKSMIILKLFASYFDDMTSHIKNYRMSETNMEVKNNAITKNSPSLFHRHQHTHTHTPVSGKTVKLIG